MGPKSIAGHLLLSLESEEEEEIESGHTILKNVIPQHLHVLPICDNSMLNRIPVMRGERHEINSFSKFLLVIYLY